MNSARMTSPASIHLPGTSLPADAATAGGVSSRLAGLPIRHGGGSRGLRARGNHRSHVQAGGPFWMDASQPLAGPTQASEGRLIPLRDRRHLPA